MSFVYAAAILLLWVQVVGSVHHPHLSLIENVLTTTGENDFGGDHGAFAAAADWQWSRLKESEWPGPYLACSEYGEGQQALLLLNEAFSQENVRRVAHNKESGACFLVLATAAFAEAILDDMTSFHISSASAFPSVLKISPGLLKHVAGDGNGSTDVAPTKLSTTHGDSMVLEGTIGLNVQVSPGLSLVAAEEWRVDWASSSLDFYSLNFWSDPAMLDGEGMHRASTGGAGQVRDWTLAAKVVHTLSSARGLSVGQTCGWNEMKLRNIRGNHVVLTGLDHLMPGGDLWTPTEKIEGWSEEPDAQMACLMTLISYLLSRPEVVRVTPEIQKRTLNAVATAITQSATITEKPLAMVGLDGTGEVIQVTDTGLDETSCFFTNGDDTQIEHGYYFDELFIVNDYQEFVIDSGGYFFSDVSRRKVVQYIDFLKPDSTARVDRYFYYGDSVLPWHPAEGFGYDFEDGHGTHVAGSAAGSTLNSPAAVVECGVGDELACSGKCIASAAAPFLENNGYFDLDTYCPDYDCDGVDANSTNCLGNDRAKVLSEHEGMAPGAKIAIFDVSGDGDSIFSSFLGNGLWEAAGNTGAKIHTNSWGGDAGCQLDDESIVYDNYLYENPDHLLIFAAGNDGENLGNPGRTTCTINFPGIAKNVLTVGASSSGVTRATVTVIDEDPASVDDRAYFSSYGPTTDNRIKPEIVAPGDRVISASADGEEAHSCQLVALFGTSMSTPIVAGAAAIVRQYFRDDAFYINDLNARGVCINGSPFQCDAFSPSGATVKAMLINSANLMGGGSEPNGLTGFGRVHLEAGLPLNGNGNRTLFVADSSFASVYSGRNDTYEFEIDESGVEMRVTLTWMDPEADVYAAVQLINDLDLKVISPIGEEFVMWSSGEVDTRNVVERVIVPTVLVEEGTWTIMVSANQLLTEMQPYSLVVLGSISTGTVVEGESFPSEGFSASLSLFGVYSKTTWVSTAIALVFVSLFGLYGPALQGN